MATTGNALSASFGLDLAPLRKDFAQAEQIAKTGAGRVQSAMVNANKSNVDWAGIARQRAQAQAFLNGGQGRGRTAADFRPAPQGKYPSPLDQSGGGLSNRGIAGIGLLTAAHQLAAVYKDAAEEAYNLRIENDKLLRPVGGSSGIDDLRQRILELAKASDDAHEQLIKDTGHGGGAITKFFALNVKAAKLAMGVAQGQGGFGIQLNQEQSDRSGFKERAAQAVEFMADKQNELNRAEAEGRTGSERTAELMKLEIEHRERLGKLAELETKAAVRGSPLSNAEVNRYRGEVDAAMRRYDVKKLERDTQESILDLQNSGLSKDNQANAAIQKRINLLKQQMVGPGTNEQKAQWGNQVKGLQNQLQYGQYAESKKPWGQKAQEMNDQQDYQNYIRNQQPTSPNAYKSHPDAYNRRDILGNKIDPNGNVIGPGGSGPDKQGVGLLGTAGVLDRIEKNTANMGANK
jgi:hypothetical protein